MFKRLFIVLVAFNLMSLAPIERSVSIPVQEQQTADAWREPAAVAADCVRYWDSGYPTLLARRLYPPSSTLGHYRWSTDGAHAQYILVREGACQTVEPPDEDGLIRRIAEDRSIFSSRVFELREVLYPDNVVLFIAITWEEVAGGAQAPPPFSFEFGERAPLVVIWECDAMGRRISCSLESDL